MCITSAMYTPRKNKAVFSVFEWRMWSVFPWTLFSQGNIYLRIVSNSLEYTQDSPLEEPCPRVIHQYFKDCLSYIQFYNIDIVCDTTFQKKATCRFVELCYALGYVRSTMVSRAHRKNNFVSGTTVIISRPPHIVYGPLLILRKPPSS